MSTEQTWQTESTSLEATLGLAERIGRKLRGGEVIVLIGDLGAGKTAFTRGLARGIGSTDQVRSPSFTLSNQYQAKELTLHHFDFYRLSQPGILREELTEVLTDPQSAVVVEWADIVQDVLPARRLSVYINASSETGRSVELRYPANLQYLVPININD